MPARFCSTQPPGIWISAASESLLIELSMLSASKWPKERHRDEIDEFKFQSVKLESNSFILPLTLTNVSGTELGTTERRVALFSQISWLPSEDQTHMNTHKWKLIILIYIRKRSHSCLLSQQDSKQNSARTSSECPPPAAGREKTQGCHMLAVMNISKAVCKTNSLNSIHYTLWIIAATVFSR